MTTPGWYPTAHGTQYWDGQQWHPGHVPQPVAVMPKKTNHALHLLLTLLTFWLFGGWAWVWIFVAINNSGKTRTVYR
ncbi:hypothetical protein KIV64_gp57 [Mycobacterium phage DroogsArmy]|uniref:DUF2510 domain-containing protein n=2 Tax=Timshelvirus TaxID=2948926 RepID=G1DB53_9CAUD|nr:hypothetical protein FDI10_gp59 [Mycobacterium phage Timshel]YP_010061989.1 hypothetical protein KIV64_gp57 [Mycobacterium phage DroogsArmy]AEJ92398.1 hypothetical protein TIMSHEL_35 [Mycobacterium phage Timshel]QKO02431.1 hypothetical protein SEA_DROOGSARMY_35 [Mycobacterium phage DroogsArmy]